MKTAKGGHFNLVKDAPVALMTLFTSGRVFHELENVHVLNSHAEQPWIHLFPKKSEQLLPVLHNVQEHPNLTRVINRLGQVLDYEVWPDRAWYEELKSLVAEGERALLHPVYPAFEMWLEVTWEILCMLHPPLHDAADYNSVRDERKLIYEWRQLQKIICNAAACSVFANLLEVRSLFDKVGFKIGVHDLLSLSLLASEETPYLSSLNEFHNGVLPFLYRRSNAHFGGWLKSEMNRFCLPVPMSDKVMGFSELIDGLNENGEVLDNIAYVPVDPNTVAVDLNEDSSFRLRACGEDELAEYEIVIAVSNDRMVYRKYGSWFTSEGARVTPEDLEENVKPNLGGVWLKRKFIDPEVKCETSVAHSELCFYSYDVRTDRLIIPEEMKTFCELLSRIEKRSNAGESLKTTDCQMLEDEARRLKEVLTESTFSCNLEFWSVIASGFPIDPVWRRGHWKEECDMRKRPVSCKMRAMVFKLFEVLRSNAHVMAGSPQIKEAHLNLDPSMSLLNWSRLHTHLLDRVQHMPVFDLGHWVINGAKKPFLRVHAAAQKSKTTLDKLLPNSHGPDGPSGGAVYVSINRLPGCAGINLRDTNRIMLSRGDKKVPYDVELAVLGDTIIRCVDQKWYSLSGDPISEDQLKTEFEPKVDGVWLR